MPIEAPKPSARALRIKERLLANEIEIDVERAQHYTSVWKRRRGPPVRTAMAPERLCDI
jgi:hypothetical protein